MPYKSDMEKVLKTSRLELRVTDAARKRYAKAAYVRDQSLSDWMRMALDRASIADIQEHLVKPPAE